MQRVIENGTINVFEQTETRVVEGNEILKTNVWRDSVRDGRFGTVEDRLRPNFWTGMGGRVNSNWQYEKVGSHFDLSESERLYRVRIPL